MIQIIQNFLGLNFLELIEHNLDNDGDFEQPWRSLLQILSKSTIH